MGVQRRLFSRGERAALFLASDGHCSWCGGTLTAGWHADHVLPFVAGGETDVQNGQALCARCNQQKGAAVADTQRPWQARAEAHYFALSRSDFLLSATPGSGKTRLACEIARRLLAEHTVERVVVVVPTDALRDQWIAAAGAGLALGPVSEPTDYEKPGYAGFVTTYQQLAMGKGADLTRRSMRRPTLAIMDEIHHAGDSATWGRALRHALENARRRLALTGTPWRSDKSSGIPFVSYGPTGKVEVDFPYEYGESVSDQVCRAIEFHAYDGEGRWADCGVVHQASLNTAADTDLSAVMDAILDPSHAWMPGVLQHAVAALDELRSDVPDAGGLVVADGIFEARAYARLLEQIDGAPPLVAASDDAAAKDVIYRFTATGKHKWLVAIKMVSEGVDIPRLAVGVYAARTRTPLFFRQVVGRFVRQRPGDDFNARLFMPAVPCLQVFAREIEDELRHALEVSRERERHEPKEPGRELFRTTLTASVPVLDSITLRGDGLLPGEHAAAEALCSKYGIPARHAASIARMRRSEATDSTSTVAHPPPRGQPETTRHTRERMLKGAIKTKVGKIARRTGLHWQEVNLRLIEAGFPARPVASVEDLDATHAYVEHWLASLT